MYMNYGLIPKELPLWSDDGYLMSHSGAIKLIDVSNLYKPQPGNPKRVAIMHKSGYLFLYKENKLLEEYLSPEWARQYMASRLRGSIQSSSGAIKDWGVWLIWK
jgi:ABC-type Fe3+ transport system substrate-binding protein